jgi:hypothetical protein
MIKINDGAPFSFCKFSTLFQNYSDCTFFLNFVNIYRNVFQITVIDFNESFIVCHVVSAVSRSCKHRQGCI